MNFIFFFSRFLILRGILGRFRPMVYVLLILEVAKPGSQKFLTRGLLNSDDSICPVSTGFSLSQCFNLVLLYWTWLGENHSEACLRQECRRWWCWAWLGPYGTICSHRISLSLNYFTFTTRSIRVNHY